MSLLNLLEEFIMFEKIRKMKNKKGFTLVELIVVLVILAILAALLIPALTGYIDKANKEKVVAECRMVVMAAQTEASEAYGKVTSTSAGAATTAANITAKMDKDNIKSLAEVKGFFDVTVDATGKITKVRYTNSGFTCVYSASEVKNAQGTVTTEAGYNTKKVGEGDYAAVGQDAVNPASAS